MENDVFDGKFGGNILIIGRTECGKTTFVQKLSLNNFFDDFKKVKWVSGIRLAKEERVKLNQIFHVRLHFHIR